MKTKIEKQNKLREKQTTKGKVAVEDSASLLEDYLARLARLARFSGTLLERLARRDLHFEVSSHFTRRSSHFT